MHPKIEAFFRHLQTQGKSETIRAYTSGLGQFDTWMGARGIDPLKATLEDLKAFQRWLADDYRSADRAKLARTTQVTRLSAVKSFYGWLARRGILLVDVSRKLKLPKVQRRVTQRDYLSLQEATALLQTQAEKVKALKEGSRRWAAEFRDLTLLSLALASGRRRSGLRNLRVQDLNFDRNELRCEREKGKAGRVLPVASWAMKVARRYVEKARCVFKSDGEWLFPTARSGRIGSETISQSLTRLVTLTLAQNPDLNELPAKSISMHSLRVSFAKMLFSGGCNLRSLNELMMHDQLQTTAYYTPMVVEDIRRVCQMAHPRA